MTRILASMLAMAVMAMSGLAKADPPPTAALADLPHVGFPAPNRIAAGALGPDDIATLKKAGVREVINLRASSEAPWFDEGAAVRAAGITYHALPIHGADGLTRDNVVRLDALLNAAGNRLTLVHCTSSNRVGALIALRASTIEGQSIDAAIEEGRRWGLQALEPAVRERLEAWSRPHPPSH